MIIPDMSYVIASQYNIVLVFLSMLQSWTFSPLKSSAPSMAQQSLIAIGFVNKNYFV